MRRFGVYNGSPTHSVSWFLLAQHDYTTSHPCQDTTSDGYIRWLDEGTWTCAEGLGLIRKSPKALDREKWGRCVWTAPKAHLSVEDGLWLEKGKMPRGWWWDAECVKTRGEARQAETTYRKGRAKLLNYLKQGISLPV